MDDKEEQPPKQPGATLRTSADAEQRRKAAALLGSASSERKAEAVRKNALLGGRPKGAAMSEEAKEKLRESAKRRWAERKASGTPPPATGRAPRPLSEFACTCGAGDSIEGHKTTCPRGLAIWRRKKAGKPL